MVTDAASHDEAAGYINAKLRATLALKPLHVVCGVHCQAEP